MCPDSRQLLQLAIFSQISGRRTLYDQLHYLFTLSHSAYKKYRDPRSMRRGGPRREPVLRA
jgi:hypothetical protein